MRLVIPSLLLAGLAAPAAHAIPITIDFTGVITRYDVANSSSFVDSLASLGGNLDVTGSITFDAETGPTPREDTSNAYRQGGTDAPGEWVSSSLTYALGIHSVVNQPGQRTFDQLIAVIDPLGDGDDRFTVYDLSSDRLSPTDPHYVNLLTLLLRGPGLVVGGDAGVDAVPNLANLTLGTGEFTNYTALEGGLFTGYRASFRLTSVTLREETSEPEPVPVPEPGTLLLTGAGLLGVAMLRRRRLALEEPLPGA